MEGQLTYASQQPWVYPGTIRSNILFGKTMNTHKYERVIKACALKRVGVFFFILHGETFQRLLFMMRLRSINRQDIKSSQGAHQGHPCLDELMS